LRRQLGEHLIEGIDPQVPTEVRDELVRTLPLMWWQDGITDGKKLLISMGLVTAIARGPAEQFYLPAALARPLQRAWTPSDTQQVLAPMAMAERAQRRPATRAASPGRNYPCPCGSGRKWKKCCGADQ